MDGDVGRSGVAYSGGVAAEENVNERNRGGVVGWIRNVHQSGEGEGVFGRF